jgi:endonuclease-3
MLIEQMAFLLTKARIVKVIDLLEVNLGVPRQKKARTDPLDMLIGTLLSQNTNDRNSHRAYRKLRSRFPTWKKVAGAPVGAIASAIRVGGMKNQKSKRIKALLKNILEKNGSYSLRVLKGMNDNDVIEMLTSFNGIGYKTAACVLLFSLRREVFPVDTHIHRISNRLGLVETKTPEKTFEAMKPLVPKGKSYSFHTNLIRFGRTVCIAQRPRCGQCPLYDECVFSRKEMYASAKHPVSSRRNTDFMLLDEI